MIEHNNKKETNGSEVLKLEKIETHKNSWWCAYELPVNWKKKFNIGCSDFIFILWIQICVRIHYIARVFFLTFACSSYRTNDYFYCWLNTDNITIIGKIVIDIKRNKFLSMASFLKFSFLMFYRDFCIVCCLFALVSVVVTLLNSNRHLVLFFFWQQERRKTELKNIIKKMMKKRKKKRKWLYDRAYKRIT